ncbi:MAG: NAD-dependent epimerase/dehydratase family protein [Deltaproteobacteria bacterium]|nr:MAG: NAD-dependent epimerase/dehydratase family protein [Deltaproteobacteria bacterium]
MKILITGGAGFIGSNIADAYLKEGHEIIVVDNFSTGKKENLSNQVKVYSVDITSPDIANIIASEKPDIINHHAAQIDVRKSVADPAYDADQNIIGSLNIIAAAQKAGVKKIIFASSGGAIYGEQSYYPADEKHPTDPRSPYGITKLTVEKYLQFYRWTYGMDFVALRYANVYGPRQNAHGEAGVIAIFCEKILRGQTPVINGDGKQTRDYVFVEDVVACNVAALNPSVSGIFNVGTSVETDVITLTQKLIQISQSKLTAQHGPAKAGEQMRSCLKPGALQTIKPASFETGLQKTFEWFSKQTKS